MKFQSKILIFTTTLVLFLVLLVPAGESFADTVVRTGDSVSIESDQTVEGDLYVAGQKVFISGSVQGDVQSLARTITINGPVEGDLFLLADNIEVHAPVSDDIRIFGGEVKLADVIGGDVFMFGGVLQIPSTAKVEGDVYFFGGSGEIKGEIMGSVYGSSNTLRIDGAVRGDVNVEVGKSLTLGSRADIAGTVTYKSQNKIVRAQEAIVVGEVVYVKTTADTMTLREKLIFPFMMLFASLLAYLFGRKKFKYFIDTIHQHYALLGLIGLSSLLVIPIGSVILSISLLGLLVGMFGMFVFGALGLASVILLGPVFGSLMFKYFNPGNEVSLISVIVGTAVVYALALVPIVGPLILFVGFAVVFGAIVYLVYKSFR